MCIKLVVYSYKNKISVYFISTTNISHDDARMLPALLYVNGFRNSKLFLKVAKFLQYKVNEFNDFVSKLLKAIPLNNELFLPKTWILAYGISFSNKPATTDFNKKK